MTYSCPERISVLMGYINKQCNFRCKYCFIDKEPWNQPHGSLPFSVLTEIVDWFLEPDRECASLVFAGEEVTMAWSLVVDGFSYVRVVYPDYPVNLSITTNGYSLTRNRIRKLKRLDAHMAISCDGVVHDKYRRHRTGRATLRRVLKAIKDAQELGVHTKVLCCMIPGELHTLPDTVKFFAEHNITDVAMNKIIEPHLPYSLEDFDTVVDSRFEAALLAEELGVQLTFMNKSCNDLSPEHRHRPRYTCGAAQGSIGFDMYGDYYPCHKLIWHPRLKIGNYKTGVDPLALEFWRNLDSETCHMCAVPGCSICYAENLDNTGTLTEPPMQYCTMERIRSDIGRMIARKRGLLPGIKV